MIGPASVALSMVRSAIARLDIAIWRIRSLEAPTHRDGWPYRISLCSPPEERDALERPVP